MGTPKAIDTKMQQFLVPPLMSLKSRKMPERHATPEGEVPEPYCRG